MKFNIFVENTFCHKKFVYFLLIIKDIFEIDQIKFVDLWEEDKRKHFCQWQKGNKILFLEFDT